VFVIVVAVRVGFANLKLSMRINTRNAFADNFPSGAHNQRMNNNQPRGAFLVPIPWRPLSPYIYFQNLAGNFLGNPA